MVNDGVVEANHIEPQPYPFLNQHVSNVNNATAPANPSVPRKGNIHPFYRQNNTPSTRPNSPNQ